jgi:hypothetical protein
MFWTWAIQDLQRRNARFSVELLVSRSLLYLQNVIPLYCTVVLVPVVYASVQTVHCAVYGVTEYRLSEARNVLVYCTVVLDYRYLVLLEYIILHSMLLL